MRWLSIFCSLMVVLPSFAHAAGATDPDEVSCTCEDQNCKACEIETNLTFYTAKCGPKNSKVKSCKRPTCEPVENTKQCLAELEQSAKAVENVAQKSPKENAPIVALVPV